MVPPPSSHVILPTHAYVIHPLRIGRTARDYVLTDSQRFQTIRVVFIAHRSRDGDVT